jgi:hypothetical protein
MYKASCSRVAQHCSFIKPAFDKHRLYDVTDTTHRFCNAPNVCAECQRSSFSRRVIPFLLHSAYRVAWKGVVVLEANASLLVVGLGFALEWIMGGRLSGIFSCGWYNLDFAWTLMSEGHRLFFPVKRL